MLPRRWASAMLMRDMLRADVERRDVLRRFTRR